MQAGSDAAEGIAPGAVIVFAAQTLTRRGHGDIADTLKQLTVVGAVPAARCGERPVLPLATGPPTPA